MKFLLVEIVIYFMLLVEVYGNVLPENYRGEDVVNRRFFEKFLSKEKEKDGRVGSDGSGPDQGAMPDTPKEPWDRFGKGKEKEHEEKPIEVKVKPLDYGYITSLGPFFRMSFPKPNAGYFGGGYYQWSW